MITLSRSTSHWLAWLLWWLTCGLTALGLMFLALSWRAPVPDTFGFRGGAAIWALAYAGTGQFLARHRPQNAIGWLFLVLGLVSGVLMFLGEYVVYVVIAQPGALPGASLAGWIASWIWVFEPGMFGYIIFLFPTGRLPSHRWRPFAGASAGAIALMAFGNMLKPGALHFHPYLDNPFAIAGSEGFADFFLLAGIAIGSFCQLAAIASIILRLRRAGGVERQQIKWFTFCAALFGIVGLSYPLAEILTPASSIPKFVDYDIVVGVAALPFTVAIAILRYRLWDIDIIIRRTLIYSVLTGTLALVYFGSVVLLQQAFRTLTGQQQSEIVIVLSTLAIAALFAPLRRRVQDVIDRRLYRRKYDAAKTLAAFSATVRDEVDLNKLTERLLQVVEETMQPASVSLWLRKK